MSTALNERELTAVSGGVGIGTIGPDNPEILKARRLNEEALILLDVMVSREPELEDRIRLVLSLLESQNFKPYDALLNQYRAIMEAQEIAHDPYRMSLIREKLKDAYSTLYYVLF